MWVANLEAQLELCAAPNTLLGICVSVASGGGREFTAGASVPSLVAIAGSNRRNRPPRAMFGRPGSESIAASEAESKERYEEIVSLLVAAGYFRARIPALSPFDKVVGGMAWCMTVSSVDVDVAFQENATIGQKIKIGETIERALRRMKCRIPLQAHQIQGLDYAAIFPVVQWLVKQARSHCPRVEATGVARPTITGGMDTCLSTPHVKFLSGWKKRTSSMPG